MPTFISLFAGIGGFDEGLRRAGWACIGQCELDPFCRHVLERRFPAVERVADIRTYCHGDRADASESVERYTRRDGRPLDLLVGGFPCQDLSVAGKRGGLGGARSGLFHEIVRIAKELKPTWGLFENVPGLLSADAGRDFWRVLSGLRECWPVVGYRILDSRHFGVAQRRRRVFLVGGPTEAGVAEVLALADGGAGDLAAGEEARAGVAARPRVGVDLARALGGIGGGQDYGANKGTLVSSELAFGGNNTSGPIDQATARNAHHSTGRLDFESETFIIAAPRSAGSNPNSNMAGRRREVPALADPIGANEARTYTQEESGNFRLHNVVPVSVNEDQRTGAIYETDHTHALSQGGGKPGQGYQAVREGSAVRRLTPIECERLQGFPDGWTCLCQPLEAYAADPDAAALACACADSARYRALGNAVTVSVIQELGARLLKQMSA